MACILCLRIIQLQLILHQSLQRLVFFIWWCSMSTSMIRRFITTTPEDDENILKFEFITLLCHQEVFPQLNCILLYIFCNPLGGRWLHSFLHYIYSIREITTLAVHVQWARFTHSIRITNVWIRKTILYCSFVGFSVKFRKRENWITKSQLKFCLK